MSHFQTFVVAGHIRQYHSLLSRLFHLAPQIIASLQRDRLNYEMVIIRQRKELFRLAGAVNELSGHTSAAGSRILPADDHGGVMDVSGSTGHHDASGGRRRLSYPDGGRSSLSSPPRDVTADVQASPPRPSSSLLSPGVLDMSSAVLRTPLRGSTPIDHRKVDALLAELSPFGRAAVTGSNPGSPHRREGADGSRL